MRIRGARTAAVSALACALGAGPGTGAGRPGGRSDLEEAGKVAYVHYDPTSERLEHSGQAHYVLQYRRTYDYQPRVRVGRGGRALVLAVRYSGVEVWVEHTVKLPKGHDPDEPWYRTLLGHELDHVAISTDERPRLLLEYLLSRPETLERSLGPGIDADRALAEAMITEAAAIDQRSVERLIGSAYERLDRVTKHGTRPIPDRAAFFEGLYTPEELARLDFPQLDRVRPLLQGASYAQAKRYGSD